MLPKEMDGRRFLKALSRLGWHVLRTHGSHRIIIHDQTGRRVTVAFHGRVGPKTIRSTLKLAGIRESDFLAALR